MSDAALFATSVAVPAARTCVHCGEAVRGAGDAAFCCAGCASAHAIIGAAGLGAFYRRLEDAHAHRPVPLDIDFAAYARQTGPDEAELDLLIDGLDCAACVWLIESLLARNPAVLRARVSLSTRRLSLRWRGVAADANSHAGLVAALGFRLAPYEAIAAAAEDDRDTRELLRSLAVAGFAAANVMLLSVAVWSGEDGSMGGATRALFHWLSAAIALPAVAYAGRPFFRSAYAALRAGRTNMDVPISIGVTLACVISLHEAWVGQQHTFFDSAITLVFFLLIGRYLDRRARGRARQSVRALLALASRSATVLAADGTTASRRVDALRPGDVLLVAVGERLGADGVVSEGASALDAALVSGESVPVNVAPGAKVFAGMVNLGGPIRVVVTAAGEHTLLSEIVRLVEAAERGRSRFIAIADRVARAYAPVVHLTAMLTFFGWMLLGGLPWDRALVIATAVLIITCPCALALAVPVVQVVASTRLLRAGVLLLSPTALERFAGVNHVVLDKTGTLTLGRPELVEGGDDTEALRIAAGMAAHSRHPLAQALVRATPDAETVEGTTELVGQGLQSGDVRLGSARYCGVTHVGDDGHSELWLTRPGQTPVRFAFADRLRPDAARAITALGRENLSIELLSGDRSAAVARAAADAGVSLWRAEVTPAGKARRLADLAAQGKRVLMIGDGLNDAPALSAAHASISPATAAEATQNAADAVFQGDSLLPAVETLRVARRADRLVRQNLALALLYNLAAVPLAIVGEVTPLIAAVAMSSSSLLVIGNALRLGARPPVREVC
ncbi:MAG: copper-translocating P-type ATPase [Reyranella sp.]|uniref:copper-translocating P-type ATPase n=1 Tax=Reyranella sp. TaxID=1929291 RepID=UPI00272FAA16|nr:copper-translocating P-type ATPase [Reyranella sp.]MDP1963907.1 copper-translocating P-type ATPase [Reyranella sp.]MDP2374258.1 copper-translocating P-type ATPase [Reyranella sp.]